jgi:hypothetical protein
MYLVAKNSMSHKHPNTDETSSRKGHDKDMKTGLCPDKSLPERDFGGIMCWSVQVRATERQGNQSYGGVCMQGKKMQRE